MTHATPHPFLHPLPAGPHAGPVAVPLPRTPLAGPRWPSARARRNPFIPTPPGPVARALLPRAAVAVALGKPGRDDVCEARPRRAPFRAAPATAALISDCGHPWPGFDGLVLALLVATVLACWSQGDLYQRAARAPRPPITRVWRGARKDG